MFARIQKERIDLSDLIESTRNADSGALVTFQGTVRRFSGDTEVVSLHYEAYEDMALKKMNQIIKDTVDRFGVNDVNVVHRIGDLSLTEDSVVICVSSEHRGDAFKACRHVIDTIKTEVPIWKQDIIASGGKKWH
ncbi:hypothetical protein IX51_01015 [uncultured archaeon]|nr:hypothetical protein IX51_01015 [uncultured archaeon]